MAAFDHFFTPSEIKTSRYAPSPTGYLHLGNLSTAWQAFLLAQKNCQPFILRIEDVDETRAIKSREQDIINDLKQFGIYWHLGPQADCQNINDNPSLINQAQALDIGPFHQSLRTHFYDMAFDYLLKSNRIYPCYCSRKDIQTANEKYQPSSHTNASLDNDYLPYPKTCRDLPFNSVNFNNQGCAWRFKSMKNNIRFYDYYLNKDIIIDACYQNDDVVIKRRDGFYSYQLAVVVDDILMNVGDVLRGQDLITNTPWQIMLYQALGYQSLLPRYHHVPLITDEQDQKLSKRNHDNALSYWLSKGFSIDNIKSSLQNFKRPHH